MDRSRKTRLALAATALATVLLYGFDGGSCGGDPGGGSAGQAGHSAPVVDRCAGLDEAACLSTPACRPEYAAADAPACDCPPCPDARLCDVDCACPTPAPGAYAGCSGAPAACGTVCEIWCEYGNVLDENGCATCACNPAPIGCPRPACDVWCEYGHVPDASGCPTCACNPGPVDACAGLSERACNAAPGCLGVYAGSDACACTPCPPGVECFCDCPTAADGDFLYCTVDGLCRMPPPPPPPSQGACRGDADCGPGGRCVEQATCAAIGCPEPRSICVYDHEEGGAGGDPCDGARRTADGSCVHPDGTRMPAYCCAAR